MNRTPDTAAPSAGAAHLHAIRAKADRQLALLLVAHFPFAVALAALHGTWVPAITVGAGLSFGAWFIARQAPGAESTRFVIAAAFGGYSALLIHESGGLIELHFHIFAWLAFTLIYRDWRVPVVGAALVAVHHLGFDALQLAGTGVHVVPAGHTSLLFIAIHAGFVVFETAVLVVLARGLEQETVEMADLRAAEASERERLQVLADALARRDLTAAGGSADGADSILRAGIGQVAELVRAIQVNAGEVSGTAREVGAASTDSERSSGEVASAVTAIASNAEKQARLVADTRTGAGEAAAAVARALDAAEAAAATAGEALADAERGIVTADEARDAMQAVEESAEAIAQASDALSRRSGEIGGFVDTITSIAEQTNLLALNAAIEAARAGERAADSRSSPTRCASSPRSPREAAEHGPPGGRDRRHDPARGRVGRRRRRAHRRGLGDRRPQPRRVRGHRVSGARGGGPRRRDRRREPRRRRARGRQLRRHDPARRARRERLGVHPAGLRGHAGDAGHGEPAERLAERLGAAADALEGLVVQFTVAA